MMALLSGTTSTVLFGLATTCIYFILSTVRVYCPDNADFVGHHLPHSCKPPGDTKADFLFRVGVVHVYGIRALLIGLMIGGSTLAATILAYIAFAHRKRVKRDATEKWHFAESPVPEGEPDCYKRYTAFLMTPTSARFSGVKNGFSSRPRSSVRPSFVALPASIPPSIRRLSPRWPFSPSPARSSVYSRDISALPRTPRMVTSPRSSRIVKQHARRSVSFLRVKTERREKARRQNAEKLAVDNDANARTNMSLIPSPLFSKKKTSSGYEIPSYYFKPPFDRTETEAAGSWASSGIPSYYLKEHDEEGRSIVDVEQGKELNLGNPKSATPTVVISPAPSLENTILNASRILQAPSPVTASKSSPTTPGMTDRSRKMLSPRGAGTERATVDELSPDKRVNCWESVYCSGYRGSSDWI